MVLKKITSIQLKNEKSSLFIFKEIFDKKYSICQNIKNNDVFKRIKENNNYKNSRNLVIILKSSVSNILLKSILSDSIT